MQAQLFHNYIKMQSKYEQFYDSEDKYSVDSNEYNYFQVLDMEDPFLMPQPFRDPKQHHQHTAATQNTYYQHQTIQQEGHNLQKISPVPEEHSPEPSQSERPPPYPRKREMRTISTDFYKLQRIVRTYKGERQQTANLNKFYRACFRSHLQTLSMCKILNRQEVKKCQNLAKVNSILPENLSEVASCFCDSFSESSALLNKIMTSSKMSFTNKIVAVKYVETLRQRVRDKNGHAKGWKHHKP